MSDTFSITLTLCGKKLSMDISRDEEAKYREAAQKVNEKVSQYRSRFAKNPNDEILAMAAFQFSLALLEQKERNNMEPALKRLEKTNKRLEEFV